MKADPNDFFRQATVRICSSLDIEIALKRMQKYVSRYIPMQFISLVLFDPQKNVIHNVAGSIAKTAQGTRKNFPLPPDKGVRARWIKRHLEFKKYVIVNELENDPDLFELFTRLGLDRDISFITVRLELEGNRIGGLWVSATGRNQYTPEHAELLHILNEPVAIAMSNALRHREVLARNDALLDDIRYLHDRLQKNSGEEIVGADLGLKPIMQMVSQVAGLDSPVLILGETGVGKEMIADAIHYASHRRNGPLIKVNCGAIPETLMDTELFGHEKGAFTGASSQKRGRFERADNGTIFLDEIGELSPQAQVRLLRVLQEKRIERVGGTKEIPVDVRIISATHRNLPDMVADGLFREDLWFRLNVFPIRIPALRERKEDIPALTDYFIMKKSREIKLKRLPELQIGAINQLLAHDWPGNIRELQNLIERALIQYQGGRLSFQHLTGGPTPQPVEPEALTGDSGDLRTLDEVASRHIRQVLKQTGGKISGPGGAAEILGLHYSTLRNRMLRLGIPFGKKKSA